MRDMWSNIPLPLKEFLKAKPEGTPDGKVVCLTVYPELSSNTNNISFKQSLGLGVYLTVYPSYRPNTEEFPLASPSGTPSGEGVYLTVYPSQGSEKFETVQ